MATSKLDSRPVLAPALTPDLPIAEYITLLNNHFQKPGQDPTALSYAESCQGPSDKAVWTVVCKVNGEVKGTGVAGTKAAAKEDAAQQAYKAIVGE
ncbi:hypothetical protein Moror_7200 [Moniliophthora roreri MCA 2997]|uniref:DRBM domain-containing protein n=2 Tax=Moniliophthora roreri TaxID=221103 RepID=V2XUL4_MONRO|nr:hypothetical protein Moror_7200 [Moniliophthora roreri MCA 2997]